MNDDLSTDFRSPFAARRSSSLFQAWGDLSLRTKLLLFALVLVTVPGGVFALIAFSATRAALEREVGIQLQQTAERGAEAVATALERARGDARSWASQDLMRDLLVGDLDKRVSRFLATVRDGKAAYLEALSVDDRGGVVAAGSGKWIGGSVRDWGASIALGNDAESLSGPAPLPGFESDVLAIAVPIENPDAAGERIGRLILIYDWGGVEEILDGIRGKLATLGKRVEAFVVDREGSVIGARAPRPSLAPAGEWRALPALGYGARVVRGPDGSAAEVLVGAASIAEPAPAWSVVLVEPASEALAPVHEVRDRWIFFLACLQLGGLAVATLLARQVMRPLDEVTRATSAIASHPDRDLPLLPVRSRNEVGQLTHSFNQMTAELKRSHEETLSAAKFAFAGELAALVAHEVRTPLSVMRSSAQMLADGSTACAADTTELVETIVAEVDRIERVVTGLIQLARPLEQRLEPTRLGELLARAADFVAPGAERQGIRITRDLGGGERPALCDAEQIYQVVLNLLVNALQALAPGGHIRLRALGEEAGAVGFEVADDGPGLPANLRERIFQPFVTGREEGSGLGLAFVERIVKAHHGRVLVRSETGKGTAFEVRLPVAEAPA
jgi:signal transduction histidine kinase